MKKQAFSYVELIFAMIFIVVMMVITLPFLSQKVKKNVDVFGEYRCWSQATGNIVMGSPETVFYEQSRYNMDTLSEPALVDECVFNRPIGATNFKITLFGGGGGGSSARNAVYNENILRTEIKQLDAAAAQSFGLQSNGGQFIVTRDGLQYVVTAYAEQEIKPSIKVAYGQGGGAGSISSFNLPLVSMPFNENGALIISSSLEPAPPADQDNAVGLAAPVTNEQGNCSYIRLQQDNIALPVNICDENHCSAEGGAAAVSGSEQTFDFTDGENYSVLKAEDGKFDVRAASAGGRAGTAENCQFNENFDIHCLNSQRQELEIGVGAAGVTSLAQMEGKIARKYVRIRLMKPDGSYMNSNYDIFLDENRNIISGVPYNTADIDIETPDDAGISGGGAIFIEW